MEEYEIEKLEEARLGQVVKTMMRKFVVFQGQQRPREAGEESVLWRIPWAVIMQRKDWKGKD